MDIKEKWLRKKAGKILPFLKRVKIPVEFLTLFRIISGFIVAILIFFGNYFLTIISLTIYQFILLLDYVDGDVARYQKRYSLKWVKGDYFFHYVVSFLFLLAITLSYLSKMGFGFISWIGIFGVITAGINCFFGMKKFHVVRIKGEGYKGIFSPIYSLLSSENPFSIFYFLMLFNLIPITIVFYSLLNVLLILKKLK